MGFRIAWAACTHVDFRARTCAVPTAFVTISTSTIVCVRASRLAASIDITREGFAGVDFCASDTITAVVRVASAAVRARGIVDTRSET